MFIPLRDCCVRVAEWARLRPVGPAHGPVLCIAWASVFICCAPAAGSRRLTGRVTDLATRPVEGATVRVRGSDRRTATDGAGRFTVELPAAPSGDAKDNGSIAAREIPISAVLRIRKEGFVPREFPVHRGDAGPEITLYRKGEKIPIIYCTDLYHPHQDPDDHFDLATIYALNELDVKLIVLDNTGGRQERDPGTVPVRQMNHITGRSIPAAVGLGQSLDSPEDAALDQPERWQGGVRRMIEVLRSSPRRVSIVTVGSVRDVAAAYNREPELMRRKVDRLLIFIGNATMQPPPPDQWFRGMEYNVSLDPPAYARIMTSDLPVYWAPCFGQEGYCTIWQARRRDLLARASDPVRNYFFYMWENNREDDPIQYLHRPADRPVREGRRSMWCCAVFEWLTADPSLPVRAGEGAPTAALPFDFRAFHVTTEVIQGEGGPIARTCFRGRTDRSRRVMVFRKSQERRDGRPIYAPVMTSATAALIGRLEGCGGGGEG